MIRIPEVKLKKFRGNSKKSGNSGKGRTDAKDNLKYF
jgi:hypothetical protein